MNDIIERYRYFEGEGWEGIASRCVDYVCGDGYCRDDREGMLGLLKQKKFVPAGRILRNSGSGRGMLLNCAVIGSGDSREEIGNTLKEVLMVAGTGCGVGITGDFWRPRGAKISSGGESSGALSWFRAINELGIAVGSGRGRRVAMMFHLSVDHPDILDFMVAKREEGVLPTANISVGYDHRFIEAVDEGLKWQLRFGGKVYREMWARDLWDEMVDSALTMGEPGFLNMTLANQMSNSWYMGELICTNPCGEQFLMDGDVCCLGSLVLDRFVYDGEFDWIEFGRAIRMGIRFLDAVLDVNEYPLRRMMEISRGIRRIGLGVMGLHSALLKMGFRYESEEGREFIEEMSRFRMVKSYMASIELAGERGPFEKFDMGRYLESGFVRDLPGDVLKLLMRHGIRNVTCLTVAPTGTTSLIAGSSSGIEPLFAPVYKVKYRHNGGWKWRYVVDPVLRDMVKDGRDISHFCGAKDIGVEYQLEVQKIVSRYVDASVSKTINLPASVGHEEFSELFLRDAKEVKGFTVYPVGSREDEILKEVPLTPEILGKIQRDELNGYEGSVESICCRSGSCRI